MLGRAPFAKPGIIRRVEDEGRPVLFVNDIARENDFIAKVETDLTPLTAKIDAARARTRREIEVAWCEPGKADCGQEGPHRQIFPIRNEVRLVITGEDLAALAKNENAVLG